MPGLASNAEAAKSWNLAKKCLAAGDVHAGYAAFSTAKRLLDEQVQTHVNQPQSKYLWRATSIEAKQVGDELLRMSAYFKESHYATLAIQTNANAKAIKKAYRNLARKYHPDKNKDTNELFVLIKTSYDILSDSSSKSRYDRTVRAKEESRERANVRARATSGIGNPRGMKKRNVKQENNHATMKKQKEVQSHIAKELKRAWKFVKMQQAHFEAAQEKERMRRYAQEKAEEKARARAEARRLAAQKQQDSRKFEESRDVADDINNIKERVMNKLYGNKSKNKDNNNNSSYEGSKEFFGDIFGEKSNNTSKKHQSKKKKATTTTGSTKYNRASENPMSSNASNNKNKNNNRDKPARVYDDGIRVRAGTDTSIDYTARNNSNRHNNNKSNPPVKIYDDGIRVRPMSVDPYEKIEKSRSKKSVFNSHAKEKITKDASSRNRSIKTKRYDDKKNDTANAKNKTVNRPMENAPMSTNTKVHIPTPPMKKDHTSNKSRPLSQQSRKTSTQKDNTINNSNNNNSNNNNTEQKLFKYTVIHGKDYGNSKIEIKKKKTRQSNNNNNNISEQKSSKSVKLPPVQVDNSNGAEQSEQHSEKDFVEEVRRMWRDAVTEAVGLGTDAKFLKRIVEKEKKEESERKKKKEEKKDAFMVTKKQKNKNFVAVDYEYFECKKCGKNIKLENVLDHTQHCKIEISRTRTKNNHSNFDEEHVLKKYEDVKNKEAIQQDGGNRMKKQNQQIKFPSNNETFECKNCGKHVLFDLAIDHASDCVRIQQLRKDNDINTIPTGKFWGKQDMNQGEEDRKDANSNRSSSNGMDSYRSYETRDDDDVDSFYDDDEDSFSSGDSDDDDDPLLDNPTVGMFWGGMNKPEVVEPSGFFSADGIFHVSPTSTRTPRGNESELQKVLKEIPLSRNKRMPKGFVQF